MKYLLVGEESERLFFREVRQLDFDAWLIFHSDTRSTQHWQKSVIETPQVECRKWYDKQFDRYKNDLGGMNALIEKNTGKLIGHCGLLVQSVDGLTELEVGYSLLPEFWGRGFATEAATKCRDYAFENNLAESLISIISVTNEPSKRVAIRNGMSLDKTATHSDNLVNIFRIDRTKWNLVNKLKNSST